MKKTLLLLLALLPAAVLSQTKWYNPQTENAKVHGTSLPQEQRSSYYQRFPDRVKNEVTPGVWGLSQHNAGQTLQFYTNAKKIVVRYTLSEGHAYPHMPATGKSGVDLYAYDEHGKEKWCAAKYNFADTVTFSYSPLIYNNISHGKGYEYVLYLPPYNGVRWLEIGVDSLAFFRFIEPSLEKPIVAYGTSITQGACASRPGMIWTNIVARQMRTPLINLGFSGNGLLEKGVLDVIKQTPAKVIILDCMPNLAWRDSAQTRALVENAVREIRTTHPQTPILITEHLGYPHSQMIDGFAKLIEHSVAAQTRAIANLRAEGVQNLHYLSFEEIAMPQDATVEAIHPSDYGMQVYADAYTKKLREILHEPIGTLTTQIPVTQRREPDNYEWRERHEALLGQIARKAPDVVIFGNSITHFWGGTGDFRIQSGKDSWDSKIAPLNALNMGMGWDKIENVLWRVYHGALDGYQAKKVIVTIGINNINTGTGEQVPQGMSMLIDAIKVRQPQAEIVINGIYPARGKEDVVAQVNKQVEQVVREKGVRFNNFGSVLLGADGKINDVYFTDGLHLNAKGYNLIADYFIGSK